MNSTRLPQPAKIAAFTDLLAWQEGHKLVQMVYRVTKNFPYEERFELAKQLNSAVVSITSNIAEGFSRKSPNEKVQFYSIALGSLTEVQNQLLIARDVGHTTKDDHDPVSAQSILVSKLLNGLIKKTKLLTHNS